MGKKKKSSNEPTDKYRCIKVPIASILHQDNEIATDNMNILQNAISRANKITTKTYFILRLWILQKYHTNIDIPELTVDTIAMAMKSILQKSA